ncbi:hypothetical protein TNCV_3378181 [Trichonephila clavipes]|nr:hypothetical protein TNCV_3378181 [Trichonephila clavipes]
MDRIIYNSKSIITSKKIYIDAKNSMNGDKLDFYRLIVSHIFQMSPVKNLPFQKHWRFLNSTISPEMRYEKRISQYQTVIVNLMSVVLDRVDVFEVTRVGCIY